MDCVLVSVLEKIEKDNVYPLRFHFKGVFHGQRVEYVVCQYQLKEATLSIGNEYIIWMKVLGLNKGKILQGNIIRALELEYLKRDTL